MIIATKSFKLSQTGINAVVKGELQVGDLLTKDFGGGKKLWKVVEILNGVCYVDEPNIWDEAFARHIGW
jgi:hypothetical protein